MSDLEAEIRELKVNEYSEKERPDCVVDILNFFEYLKMHADHLSRDDLERMIKQFLYNICDNRNINDIQRARRELLGMARSDNSMPNRLKKNVLDILNEL